MRDELPVIRESFRVVYYAAGFVVSIMSIAFFIAPFIPDAWLNRTEEEREAPRLERWFRLHMITPWLPGAVRAVLVAALVAGVMPLVKM